MLPCTTLNVAASLAMVALMGFAGCASGKPAPAAPSPAPGGPAKPEAKAAPDEPAGGPSAGASADPAAAGGDPSSAGADKAGAEGDKETRTTEVIQKLVQDHRKPVRECYEKARKQIPELKGTMTIRFVLDPEGKVKEAALNVEKSEVKSPDVVECAVAIIKKIKFPPSSRGMETTVNYPYTFNP